MEAADLKFVATGGNRHPSAADWDHDGSGTLAFGAGNNIALWNPLDSHHRGIHTVLAGHTDTVNAITFPSAEGASKSTILSGSSDKTIRAWTRDDASPSGWRCSKVLTDHSGSINCIAALPGSDIFISGAADASIKIWKLFDNGNSVELLQSVSLNPRFFPLALSLTRLECGGLVLAVAGTRPFVQIFVSSGADFSLAATLTGHEGWVRSLSFVRETKDSNSDLLLASASQDKYIRLWRLHQGEELPKMSAGASDPTLGAVGKSLSNKAHRFKTEGSQYSITFEALLLGHEDWIFDTSWKPFDSGLQLLSASADNSLAIWEPDPVSGIWVCAARLGEISAQKGATTATGSTGGFWIGLWSPDGSSVVGLGRTGSWRLWNLNGGDGEWKQGVAATGHTREVKDIKWSKDGSYLLSTSSDQTTRLYAEWKDDEKPTWHEFSRPQIHGYDLNCIDSITDTQFVSGADEKLLRVFDEPATIASLLDRACHIRNNSGSFPQVASIPVLSLSNKAVQRDNDDAEEEDVAESSEASKLATPQLATDLDHPPSEDGLSRHTLWPEKEKLYGHGYEISTVAASHDGSLLATACRASSIDHAVIRLYETKEWRELKPVLTAHSLTVTGLEFSDDDKYLISVGRDRQWALWKRSGDESKGYQQEIVNPKGHSRMILGCAWLPSKAHQAFATAGRDKAVKVWKIDGACAFTHMDTSPVTAVAIAPRLIGADVVLAYGTETGSIGVCTVGPDLALRSSRKIEPAFCPSGLINRLAWRTESRIMANGIKKDETTDSSKMLELAAASNDTSVRLYGVRVSNAT